ncbi:MAG: hypothetical protein HY644_08745 [Acidobacteria bacterium]|nr:hypothetical protein [Acidobacteriota bacterium]
MNSKTWFHIRLTFLWHLVLLGTVLLMIWLPVRFLTQDGPSHVYTAKIFRQLLAGMNLDDCCYVVIPPPPNSMTAWTGALLVPLVGTAVTEKLWATLYVFLMVGGGLYLGSTMDRGNSSLGIYLFLLNPFLFAGFWNFNLALGIFLFALGCAGRLVDSFSLSRGLFLGLLAVVLYFTHFFLFAAFGVALFLFMLTGSREPAKRWRARRRLVFYLVLSVLALGGTGIVWKQVQSLGTSMDVTALRRLPGAFTEISLGDLNVWYRYGEQRVMPVVEIGVLATVIWRMATRRFSLQWVLVFFAFLFLFFLFPDQVGVAMAVKARFWLLLMLFGALCLPSRWTPWIGLLCSLLLSWHASQIVPRQFQWNRQTSRLLEVSHRLESKQTQASLMGIYWGRGEQPRQVFPLLHADLLLAAETAGVSVSSNQLWSGEFAVRYRGRYAVAADRIVDLLMRENSSPDVLVGAVTNSPIRYVVVWKTGKLPWMDLKRQWHLVQETPDFLVLDIASSR